MIVAPGSTDVTTYFKLVDPTAGTPETGLTITDLDATYIRDRAAAVKADLTALAAVDSAHGDNKAIQIDATNAPGLYRVDWPDAAFAAGVARVQLVVNGAAIDPAVIEVELIDLASVDANVDAILDDTGTSGVLLTSAYDAAKTAASASALSTVSGLVDDLETRLTATRAGYLDKLANISDGSVTVVSPVSADATLLTLVRGDDYDNDESRALEFSSDDWPVLTSATITMTIRYSGRLVCTATGSVVTGTGTTKTVRVELTSAQTTLFAIGTRIYDFDVQATLASTARKVTLARGKVTVLEDYTI